MQSPYLLPLCVPEYLGLGSGTYCSWKQTIYYHPLQPDNQEDNYQGHTTHDVLELFDGEVSLVKYVTELTKVVVGRNSMLLEGNKIVQFTGYQPWFLPTILKFNQLKTKFHLEVVDKAERKININVAVFKDTTELLNAVVNNVEVPYMMVVKAPVLPLEMKVDYKQSAKVWDVKINNESYLKVRQ